MVERLVPPQVASRLAAEDLEAVLLFGVAEAVEMAHAGHAAAVFLRADAAAE